MTDKSDVQLAALSRLAHSVTVAFREELHFRGARRDVLGELNELQHYLTGLLVALSHGEETLEWPLVLRSVDRASLRLELPFLKTILPRDLANSSEGDSLD